MTSDMFHNTIDVFVWRPTTASPTSFIRGGSRPQPHLRYYPSSSSLPRARRFDAIAPPRFTEDKSRRAYDAYGETFCGGPLPKILTSDSLRPPASKNNVEDRGQLQISQRTSFSACSGRSSPHLWFNIVAGGEGMRTCGS